MESAVRIVNQVGVPIAIIIFMGVLIWRAFRYSTKENGPIDRITKAHVKFIETVEDSVRRQDVMMERIIQGQASTNEALDRNTATLHELVELHRGME